MNTERQVGVNANLNIITQNDLSSDVTNNTLTSIFLLDDDDDDDGNDDVFNNEYD